MGLRWLAIPVRDVKSSGRAPWAQDGWMQFFTRFADIESPALDQRGAK
jgi:hypothetical protein